MAAVTAPGGAFEGQPANRAVHGMVSSRSFEAEADAVISGVLAARLVSAGLRAGAGDFDKHDAAALNQLVDLLAAEGRSPRPATSDYVRYAFAHATHEAGPGGGGAEPGGYAEDLDQILDDARLILRAGTAPDAAALDDPAVTAAAQRIADRYRAVSDRVMARAGGPGDTLGGWDA